MIGMFFVRVPRLSLSLVLVSWFCLLPNCVGTYCESRAVRLRL